jgi:hypothetical protein
MGVSDMLTDRPQALQFFLNFMLAYTSSRNVSFAVMLYRGVPHILCLKARRVKRLIT